MARRLRENTSSDSLRASQSDLLDEQPHVIVGTLNMIADDANPWQFEPPTYQVKDLVGRTNWERAHQSKMKGVEGSWGDRMSFLRAHHLVPDKYRHAIVAARNAETSHFTNGEI